MYKYILRFVFLFLLFLTLIKPVYAAGVIRDVSDPANFNIRIDGAVADDQLGYTGASQQVKAYTDINRDGKLDLVIGAVFGSNNGRSDSGSVYIISGEILDNYSGTGNTIDLSDSSNYNLRIDGNLASANLPTSGGVIFGDINNDGIDDMVISESWVDSIRGNVYILFSSLYEQYMNSTGNTLDLADSSSYNILLQGAGTGDSFGNLSLNLVDLDNDNKKDLLLEAHHTDYNSRGESGSVYIFFNTLLNSYSGTGNFLSMTNTSNFSVRIDGALAGHTIGGGATRWGDFDNDGDTDLIISTDYASYNSRSRSGSIWIIDNSKISSLAGTSGNLLDMADDSLWVVRLDGTATEDRITYANSLIFADINHDGLKDLVVGSYNADYNSRSNSGSIWLIDNSVFSSYTGSGNTVDLTGNISARIDGAKAGDQFTIGSMAVADINNNGRNDILASSRFSDTNGTDSGATYVFYDSLIDSWSNGATIDILDTDNFSIRYDGKSGETLQFQQGFFGDFNGDGQPDILLNSRLADNNSRSNSGSYYLIYGFPHTFKNIPTTADSQSSLITINGDIAAASSITTIAGVQYSVDANSPSGGTWYDCSARDGIFDSRTEAFTCNFDINSIAEHTIYLRAVDSDGFYTSSSSFAVIKYNYSASVPFCSDFITSSIPNLFQIDTTVDTATVYFVPILGVSDYYLSFSVQTHAEEHGAKFSSADNGVQQYSVNYLSPDTTYYFKIRGQSGCAPGNWSNIFSAKTKSAYVLVPITDSEELVDTQEPLENMEETDRESTQSALISDAEQNGSEVDSQNEELESKQSEEERNTGSVLGGFDFVVEQVGKSPLGTVIIIGVGFLLLLVFVAKSRKK